MQIRLRGEAGNVGKGPLRPGRVNFTGGMQLQGSEFTGNEVVVFDLDGDGRFAAGMVRFETKDLRTATNAHIFAQGNL